MDIKSFAQWCTQKSTMPPETRKTIDVLLKKAATADCQQADSKLSSLARLDLPDMGISDLQPLASFRKLEWLILANNQISDLRPLSNLQSLSHLFLSGNNISDIKPLSSLSLSILYLNNNPVSRSSHHLDIPSYTPPPEPEKDNDTNGHGSGSHGDH
jgi:internalin A